MKIIINKNSHQLIERKMLELLVPYKEDCVERKFNKNNFMNFYRDFHVRLIEDYGERKDAFNLAAHESTSKYIALTDVDCIISADQIDKAIHILEYEDCDVVYPYDYILNVYKDGSVKDTWPHKFHFGLMVIFNRQKFIEFGGENDDLIGYGYEDMERYYRALNYGLRVGRVEGSAIHLQHPRFGFDNPHLKHNKRLYEKERDKWFNRQT